MHPQVELVNISKRFGGVAALQEVSLKLQPGEVRCLAGENGSGKSTLIKVLAGVHQADEGTIHIGEHRFRRLAPMESVQHGIQVIYQDFSLFPNLTVLENLSLNSQLEHGRRLVNRRQMRQIAEQAIQRIGVELPLETIAGELPTSQKQLIAIARALVQDARLIILDEPTTALTHIEVERLFDILRKLKLTGVSILFVSHKLREMSDISDCYTILRNGVVVDEGPAQEFNHSRIIQGMTGRSIETKRRAATNRKPQVSLLKASELKSTVLKSVSLDLYQGRITGLTGLLGAGQTELALALFGLQTCDSGSVQVEGFAKLIYSIQDALEAGIAYVPEDRLAEGLFLDQSIEDNLIAANMEKVQGDFGILSPHRIGHHAEHWLKELEIAAPSKHAAVRTLSGGNQQRVVLAKWLSRNPKILILNGPTVGVDIGSKARLHEKFKQLAEQGMSILLISDDLPELVQNCHSVLVMHRGQIVHEFLDEKLTENAISDYLDELK